MSEMGLIVGVHAGASGTHCVVGTARGRILVRARAGPADLSPSGAAGVRDRALDAIKAALALLAAGGEAPEVVCVCGAGLGRQQDRDRLLALLVDAKICGRVAVDAEEAAVLAAGTLGHPGVAVVADAGAAAYGVNAKGERARAGGPVCGPGDAGGACSIGREVLSAIVRAADGRGELTSLSQAVLRRLGAGSVDELIDMAPALSTARAQLADIAALVAAAARQGDRVARGILRHAGTELGAAAAAVVRSLGMQDEGVCCVVWGSVFSLGRAVREALARELARAAPSCEVFEPRFPPAVGAFLLAAEGLGCRITGRFVAHIEDSLMQAPEEVT